MADYDVAVVRLTSPPAAAYLTAYRPGVEMENLGIHNRIAYGTLSIYNKTTGLLIKTVSVQSSLIPPGDKRVAESTEYWTPPEVGTYLAIATVTCLLDQVEPNNHLSPATFVVSDEPPPPPPEVPAHATQHEDGGSDELTLENMSGLLLDPQTPILHQATHAVNGDDVLAVDGLSGQLADGQTPLEHKASHEFNGDDKISVAGLSGELSDDQPPKEHTSAKHDSSVEATANKGTVSGYAPLDADTKLPLANLTAGVEMQANKGAVSGYAPLDADTKLPLANLTDGVEMQANKGAVSGYAPLDANSRVPRINSAMRTLFHIYAESGAGQPVEAVNEPVTLFNLVLPAGLVKFDFVILRAQVQFVTPESPLIVAAALYIGEVESPTYGFTSPGGSMVFQISGDLFANVTPDQELSIRVLAGPLDTGTCTVILLHVDIQAGYAD